jgi:zinc protease
MMMEGAGTRDALQLADAIDYLGAQIGASAGMHTSAVTLQTPVARLDSALALQADVLLRPAFAAPELERKRKSRLTTLLQWRDEPRSLVSLAFNRQLYGTEHCHAARRQSAMSRPSGPCVWKICNSSMRAPSAQPMHL